MRTGIHNLPQTARNGWNIKSPHILVALFLMFFHISGLAQIDVAKYLSADAPYLSPPFSRKNCSPNDVINIYTVAEVKDSVFMDMIVQEIDNVWHNDSIYNLIKREYYPHMEIGKDWTSANIYISHRDSIPHDGSTIVNTNLLPPGYDEEKIRQTPVIEVSLYFPFFPGEVPSGRFYTKYKGKEYFHHNDLILQPTSKKKEILQKFPFNPCGLFLPYEPVLYIYLDGKLYLDPFDDKWRLASE